MPGVLVKPMSNENPYEPPTAVLQDDTNRAATSSTSAGLLNINTRTRDNLVQAGIIGVTMLLVSGVGTILYGVVGILSGAFLGLVAGLLISGTYLLIVSRK